MRKDSQEEPQERNVAGESNSRAVRRDTSTTLSGKPAPEKTVDESTGNNTTNGAAATTAPPTPPAPKAPKTVRAPKPRSPKAPAKAPTKTKKRR